MSQYGSWSVKGIDDRARAVAKEQARQKGVTLGDYINDLLLAEQNAVSADDTYDMLAESGLSNQLEDIDRRIQDTENRSAKTVIEVEQAMRGLLARLEHSEQAAASTTQNTQNMLSGFSRSLEAVEAKIDTVVADSSTGPNAKTFHDFEQALNRLAAHVHDMDRQAHGMAVAADQKMETALVALNSRLDGLEDKIDVAGSDTGGSTRKIDLHTKEQVKALTDRLLALESNVTEKLAGGHDADSRYKTLVVNVTSALKTMGETLTHIEQRVDRAESVMDTNLKASERTFAGIEEHIENFAHRYDPQKDEGLREHMENMFEHFATRLQTYVEQKTEEITASHDSERSHNSDSMAAGLEQRLTANIERSDQALAALGDQIGQLKDELNARLGGIDAQKSVLHNTISEEIAKFAERFNQRVNDSAQQSSADINEIGSRVSTAIKSVHTHQQTIQDTLKDQLAEVEKRQEARLSEVLNNISDRLSKMQDQTVSALSPVQENIASLTARLEAFEAAPEADQKASSLGDDGVDSVQDVQDVQGIGDTDEAVKDEAVKAVSPTDDDFDFASGFDEFESPEETEPDTITRADLADNFSVSEEEDESVLADNFSVSEEEDESVLADNFAVSEEDESVPELMEDHPEDSQENTYDADILEPSPEFAQSFAPDDPEPVLQQTETALPSAINRAAGSGDYLERARQAAIAAAPANAKRRNSAHAVVEKKRFLGKLSLFGGACALTVITAVSYLVVNGMRDSSAQNPPVIVTAMAEPDTMAVTIPAAQPESDSITGPDNQRGEEEQSSVPDRAVASSRSQDVPVPAETGNNGQLAGINSDLSKGDEATFVTLESAALAGNRIAEFRWGEMRLDIKDYNAGSDFVRRAARQELPAAQYRLAKLYEEGLGVPRDLSEARFWAEKAARGGNVKAMHDLGVFYADGSGGPQSYAAAAEWFRKAADFGLIDSQYNLAVMYENGLGISQSQSEALYWYQIAAVNGDSAAASNIANLTKNLPSEQVEQALERTLAWVAVRPVASANGDFGPQTWESQASAESTNGPVEG